MDEHYGVMWVTVDSADDRDEMGICIEPPEYVAGLRVFDQWVYRTQSEGARSGPGDVDRVVYARHGIEPKRLLSDNAWCYTHNRALAKLLARRGIRHRTIRPHRPQTNGKVERYQQTLTREWARGQVYRSSDHRAAALSHWLRYYNERRGHVP